jgi:predicted GIY-YIG superfamily endonuclease
MNNYYVYIHKTKDGTPFYVGKGKGKRAWSTNRNANWKEFVQRIGEYDIELSHTNLSEEKALDIEKKLISEIGLDKLTNISAEGYITHKQFNYNTPKNKAEEWFNEYKALVDLFYNYDKIYKKNPQLALELMDMVNDYNALYDFMDSLKKYT